jgi:hypothetical protein
MVENNAAKEYLRIVVQEEIGNPEQTLCKLRIVLRRSTLESGVERLPRLFKDDPC